MSSIISSIPPPKLVFFAGAQQRVVQSTRRRETAGIAKISAYKPERALKGAILKIRQVQVLRDLRTNIRQLVSEIDVFSIPDRNSLAEARVAVSSAPDKIVATAFDRAPLQLHQEEISYLAQAQINTSKKLITTETPSLNAGDYTFDLTVGDDSVSIEVALVTTGNGADDNFDFLSKIGREIMNNEERLEAYLTLSTEPDEDNVDQDMVALSIKAKETGRGITFDFTDTSGELIETLGINRISQGGGQARIYHDQRPYSPDYNALVVSEDKLALKLIKPTDRVENIKVEKGLEAVLAQAKGLIDRYNGFLSFLKVNSKYINPNIRTGLRKLEEDHSQALHRIGLTSFGQENILTGDIFLNNLVTEPELIQEVLKAPEGFFTHVREALVSILGRDAGHYTQIIKKDSYASPKTTISTYENRGISNLSLIV